MATLSTAEQRGAVDGLLKVAHEDPSQGGVILNYLKTVLPAFTWDTQLRTRAALWQPFLDDGLSINAWCDEVIRYAAVYSNQ
jgi:hypothetical protein